MTKRYVTKYALTVGIEHIEGEIYGDNRFVFRRDGEWLDTSVSHREHFRTREDAVKRADVKRRAKIEALRKQISQLEQLEF